MNLNQSEVRGQIYGNDDDVPDVMASINVNNEIVRGTASLQQSRDSRTFLNDAAEDHVKIYGGEVHPFRAQSQAHQHQVRDRVLDFVESDAAVVGDDPRSFQGKNIIGGGERAKQLSQPITQTIHAHPVNVVFRESFEDDWQNRSASADGYDQTEEGHQEQRVILSQQYNSHQTTEMTNPSKVLETTLTNEILPTELHQYSSKIYRQGQLEEAKLNDRVNEKAQDDDDGVSDEQYSEKYEDQEREDNEEWVQVEEHRAEPVKQHRLSTIDKRNPRDSNLVVQEELERLVINLNHTAMANLKNDNFNQAKNLLLKAEQNLLKVDIHVAEISESIGDFCDTQFTKKAGIGPLDALKNRLMGLTYNNLGCLCKQQQDFHGALAYLKAALDYESRLEEYEELNEEEERNIDDLMEMDAKDLEFQMDLRTLKCNSAGTILNICAILSKINKHKQAHEYACEAVIKLRHSMKLTKSQVVQEQHRIGLVYEKLNRESAQIEVQSAKVQQLKMELQKAEENKMQLESQWVNLATTAVIAHYNAAVELEFMSRWREALSEYEKAAKLSAIAMKANNPMTVKIKQAIGKMRIKVRNNVQLPEKFVVEGASSKRKPGKSQIVGSKQSPSIQAMKDWQNSVNSVDSSHFYAYQQRIATVSNQFRVETSQDKGINSTQVPHLYSIDGPIRQKLPITGVVTRDSQEGSLGFKQVGLRPVIKTRTDVQSPISLRKIINKLEKTEKLQNAPVLLLHPRKTYVSSNKSSKNEEESTLSVLWGRQNGLPPRITTLSHIKGGKVSRNEVKRGTLNSAGFNSHQSVDQSFLPSLKSQFAGTQGFQTARNSRISTVQGQRAVASPLNNRTERVTTTGVPVKKRAYSKPPPITINAWGVIPSIISEQNYPKEVSYVGGQEHGPSEQQRIATGDGISTKKQSLNMAQMRLQNLLSVTHERRLIEESKKLEQEFSKREKDISFFFAHIKPKNVGKKSRRPNALNTISTDLATVRQQVLMDSSASHLAGSAYLPKRLKKTLQERKFASQIQKMQNKIIKEHQQDLNLQLETAFQREIALWRHDRDDQIYSKLKEIEDLKAQQDFLEVQFQQKLAAEYADVATPILTSKESKTDIQNVQSELADILCAEQAQEAVSILQETGPSINNYEEEVGNLRVSPPPPAGHKKVDLQSIEILVENHTLVGHGQIKVMEKFSEDIREEKPDTAAEVNLQSSDQVKGPVSSDVSEYESSIDMTNDNQLGSALSNPCQEVDQEQTKRLKSVSETLEVLDIVSADTNNALLNNNNSQRTSEHIFNNTHGEITSQVTTQQMLYKTRFNADSALNQTVSETSAVNNKTTCFEGNRGQKAQSSLQMMPNFDPMEDQEQEDESESIVAPSLGTNRKNAPQELREMTFEKQRRSQLTGRQESSIAESHISGTQMTHKDEPHFKKTDLNGTILHEEMLEGWKIQVDVDTPDLTDDNMTIAGRKSPIGEGPIYIKKSIDYKSKGRATQKLNKMKTNVLEPISNSLIASEMTFTTNDVRYKSGSRIGEYQNQLGFVKTQKRMRQDCDSLAERSLAQTSELVVAKFGSALSIEVPSIEDDVSQITDKFAAKAKPDDYLIQSGQTSVYPHRKELNQQTQKKSFLTPRPVQIQAGITRDIKKTLERSSIDTEQPSNAVQGHIKHAKPQPNKRLLAGAANGKTQMTKRYVAVMAQKPLRTNSVVKPLDPAKNQSTAVQKSSQIPAMIHVLDGSVMSPIVSPTNVVKRLKTTGNKTSGQQTNFAISASNNHNQTLKSKDLQAMMDQSNEQQLNQRGTDAEDKVIQTEDRMAKIQLQISKLNTTLLQFQTEAEELKKDPMLKSTHRSDASRVGLVSQKSRDTNMTMPVTFPDQVKALQEKRLMAQLQSAPGRTRGKPGNFNCINLIEKEMRREGESPIAPRMQTQKSLLANQEQNYDVSPMSVTSTIKSVMTIKTNQ